MEFLSTKTSVIQLYESLNTHLLTDDKPSVYLSSILEEAAFHAYPFTMLKSLNKTAQSPTHHPEGNVWNHTLMVVDYAAKLKSKSNNPTVFLWAALLHDIGKPSVTKIKKGRILSYEHDKAGQELSMNFLSCFSTDADFIKQVSLLVRYHMHILFVINHLPFADIEGMKRDTDLQEIALLGLCDRLGRKGADVRREINHLEEFFQICGIV